MSKDHAMPEVIFLKRPCSYLEDRDENLLYLMRPPQGDQYCSTDVFDSILNNYGSEGMRRSGDDLYLPVCQDCTQCVSTRVLAQEFQPARKHRRTMRANSDIEIKVSDEPLVSDMELFSLYSKYIKGRHNNGAMYPPEFKTMQRIYDLGDSANDFHIYGFSGKSLMFVAMTDQLEDGLSANYTIFNPDLKSRSLGTLAILTQIDLCQQLDLPYLYLGYRLSKIPNMSYKGNFHPQERFIENQWQRVNKS